MSKRKKNYPDPGLIVQNYGADALRWDLCLKVSLCFLSAIACMQGAGSLATSCSLQASPLKGLNHSKPSMLNSSLYFVSTQNMHTCMITCKFNHLSPLIHFLFCPEQPECYGHMAFINKALCMYTICWHIHWRRANYKIKKKAATICFYPLYLFHAAKFLKVHLI